MIVPNDDRLASNDQDADFDGTEAAPQKLIVQSVRELPSAERLALGAGASAAPEGADRCELPAQVDASVAEDRVHDVVSQIRPLLDRVTDRGWIREHVRRGQTASRIRSS